MQLANCVECGRVFRPVGGRRLCPACLEIDQQQFSTVRDYLKKHPGAGIVAISEGTGVSIKRIQEYLREGRLVLATTDEWLQCERCGASLTTGRLCDKCADEMRRGISPKAKPAAQRPSAPEPQPREHSPYRGTGKKVVRDKFRRW